MRLICCEMNNLVGVVSVGIETGLGTEAVKRILKKRGVKHSGNAGYGSCNVFDSRLVADVFKDFNPEYPL